MLANTVFIIYPQYCGAPKLYNRWFILIFFLITHIKSTKTNGNNQSLFGYWPLGVPKL